MQTYRISPDSLMPVTPRPNTVFVRGEGAYLCDTQGRRYLDWVQGWAVNRLGHAPPAAAHALAQQAAARIHPSPAFHSAPKAILNDLDSVGRLIHADTVASCWNRSRERPA